MRQLSSTLDEFSGPSMAKTSTIRILGALLVLGFALSPALAARIQKRLQEKCKAASDIRVEFKANGELRIEMTVRNDSQITAMAVAVLELSEIAEYRERLDLQFKIAQ